jgi:hypothetical protein
MNWSPWTGRNVLTTSLSAVVVFLITWFVVTILGCVITLSWFNVFAYPVGRAIMFGEPIAVFWAMFFIKPDIYK